MGELDERVSNGLRQLVGRAPVGADVWVDTERRIERAKRRRQAIAAATAVAIVAVLTIAGVHATTSPKRVRVATPVPPATHATTPRRGVRVAPTAPVPTPATTPSTSRPTSTITTPTTLPTASPTVNVCPFECLGLATADVDGDGRPDQIGLFANPPLSGNITAGRPSKLDVRVVFANGRVADYHDTAVWDASLVGAVDLNGDGRADIFYFNFTGANNRMGHILRWNGSQLVAVQGSTAEVQGADGTAFTTFTSGYAMGADGFRCVNNSYISMTIHDDGVTADSPTGWNASQTTYRLHGNELVKTSGPQPIAITKQRAGTTSSFYVPPQYDQIMGVHCPGVPFGYPYLSPTAP
jgi:hypothetical protein